MSDEINNKDSVISCNEHYQDMIYNWFKSDVVTLGNQFHGSYPELDKGMTQETPDRRVRAYYLNRSQLKSISEDFPLGSFSGFRIHMSLECLNGRPGELNFRPLLEVVQKEECRSRSTDDKLRFFELTPGYKEVKVLDNTPHGTDPEGVKPSMVPLAYLNGVADAWARINPALIDDSFLSLIKRNDQVELEKILHYNFSKKCNSGIYGYLMFFFRKKRFRLNYVGFHLGLDMNKELIRESFTFSPVIELNYSEWVKKSSDHRVFWDKFKNRLNENDLYELKSFKENKDLSWPEWRKNHLDTACKVERLFCVQGLTTYLKNSELDGGGNIKLSYFLNEIEVNDSDTKVTSTNAFEYLHPCPPFGCND